MGARGGKLVGNGVSWVADEWAGKGEKMGYRGEVGLDEGGVWWDGRSVGCGGRGVGEGGGTG